MYVYRRRLHTVVQAVLDGISLVPVWACATQLRILMNPVMAVHVPAQYSAAWVPPMALVLLLWLVVSVRLRLYSVPDEVRPWTLFIWASENAVAVCALTVLATFFSREVAGFSASRMFVLCMVPVSFIALIATRCLTLAITAAVQRWWQPPRIVLIGDSSNAGQLLERLRLPVRAGICGVIVPEGSDLGMVGQLLPVLGTTGQIAELINRERIDRVIVLNGSLPNAEFEHCNRVFRRMGLPVSSALDLAVEPGQPSLLMRKKGRIELSTQYGLPIVWMRPAPATRTHEFVKLAFDFGVALVSLIFLAPVMLLTAIAVKLHSAGPALEKAPRVGKGGRHFTCLKFRTTFEDLNLPAPAVTWDEFGVAGRPAEQRVTPLGRFLRRYSIDELPQLINILRREMSFVGPRPLPAHNLGPDGMSREFFTWSETRARVHPGLTGLWQVRGRSDLPFDEMIRLDLEYIRNRSLALDVWILLRTPVAVLRGLGAS